MLIFSKHLYYLSTGLVSCCTSATFWNLTYLLKIYVRRWTSLLIFLWRFSQAVLIHFFCVVSKFPLKILTNLKLIMKFLNLNLTLLNLFMSLPPQLRQSGIGLCKQTIKLCLKMRKVINHGIDKWLKLYLLSHSLWSYFTHFLTHILDLI